MRKLLRWALDDIRSGKNLDVWVLVALAFVFAILGILGIDEKLLIACTLGLLGVLAISQIKSRDQVSEVAATWHRGRTAIFSSDFPKKYHDAQKTASMSYFFAGTTMARTLPLMEQHIIRILKNGGSVRILLPDPDNNELLKMVAASRGDDVHGVRQSIQHTLASAKRIRSRDQGDFKIRTTQVLPRVGINAMELRHPSATIMIQMYDFASQSESKPIFLLTPADEAWFNHFEEEIERLWEAGTVHP